MKEYLETITQPNTNVAYKLDIQDFSRWYRHTYREEVLAENITRTVIVKYLDYLVTEKKAKPATVNRRMAALVSWLRWEKEKGYIKEVPEFPPKITEVKHAPKALHPVDKARLIRIVDKRGTLRDKAIFSLALFAGLRVSEICNLERRDIETSERKGKVIVRNSKGRKTREVPLNKYAPRVYRPIFENSYK